MIRIFFSWQSDIGQDATTRAIRQAVAQAVAAMITKHGSQVVPDEATSNVAGSPYIPGKLAEKIQHSDIFICDVTSIAVSRGGKSLPNPNVTFELGLAAAHLGWERVVMLFNEELAEFKNLPFDFDRHRISKYKMADSKAAVASRQGALDDLVKRAVNTIIDQNPLRPRDLEGKSEAQTRHDRDVVNLRWFFRHMSVDLLGKHTREMPDKLNYFASVMCDGLDAIIQSPSFYLYDAALEKRLRALVSELKITVAHDEYYRETSNFQCHILDLHSFHNKHKVQDAFIAKIENIIASLTRNLNWVIKAVRKNYIEVDLDDLSQKFNLDYIKMIKQK
jgi:hypothetical protein